MYALLTCLWVLFHNMNSRILKDESETGAFDTPIDLVIHTKAPGKWKLIDLETGEEYLGSEVGTAFAEVLREKVSNGKIGTWIKIKGKE